MANDESSLSSFVKFSRRELKLTQQDLAEKAGVGLRFVRDLEQGKASLRMDKVNQVLQLFGYSLSPRSDRTLDPFYIHRHHFNRRVRVTLKDRTIIMGIIVGDVIRHHLITGWKFVANNDAKRYMRTRDESLIRIIDHSDMESIQNIDE
ncbi:MAG TPA: helix-turn-helix transcriptional regulator [Puia sp.]|nr:helix-turn-helix transcriptional regulator [Puia sp.]